MNKNKNDIQNQRRIPIALKIFLGFVVILLLVNLGNIIYYYQFSMVSELNKKSVDTFFRMSMDKRITEEVDELFKYLSLLETIDDVNIGEEKNTILSTVNELEDFLFDNNKKNAKDIDRASKSLGEFRGAADSFFVHIDNGLYDSDGTYGIISSPEFKKNLETLKEDLNRISDPKISEQIAVSESFESLLKQAYYIGRVKNSQNVVSSLWDSVYTNNEKPPHNQESFLKIDSLINVMSMIDITQMSIPAVEDTLQIEYTKSEVIGYFKDILSGLDAAFLGIEDKENLEMAKYLAESSNRHIVTSTIILWGSVGTALLSILLAIFLANKIARPIHNLRKATYRASLGKYDQKLQVTTHDEVGGLVEDFNSMMDALARLDEMKSHFMAAVTHDLKSPLNRIKQRMSNIEDGLYGEPPAWMTEQLEDFWRDVDTLLNLVHNHLDLQKIETGKFNLEKDPIPLKTFIRQSMQKHIVSYQAKGVGLFMKAEVEDIPVLFDREHMSRVMDNLLTNSLKYSSRGDTVSVYCDLGNDLYTITVADEGPGIPEERKPYIFDKFYQVPGTKVKGTGLGLTITREIIEAHGGTIKAIDNKPKGSKFIFTIPSVVKEGSNSKGESTGDANAR